MQVTDADLQPYRALAASVIWQGVADAVLAEKCNQKSAAAGWLLDDSDAPLTFRWWCEVGDIDPVGVRDQVVCRWRVFAWKIEQGFNFGEVCDEESRREASEGEADGPASGSDPGAA